MEDGNVYDPTELDNKSSSFGEKKYSIYSNANGGSEVYKKSNSSLYDNDVSQCKLHDSYLTKNKNKHNSVEQQNTNVKPIPKPLITKHSVLKTVIKRTNQDFKIVPKVVKENGDVSHTNPSQPFDDKEIDEEALQKAINRLHGISNNKTKPKLHSSKKRKVENTSCNAQYLGLQPAVKFKCSKCSSTFPSLSSLKQHHHSCVPPHQLPAQKSAFHSQTSTDTNLRFTRSVYLCSACGTYYESWNLFLHIREVHNRHTCLFCFGMFSQAHKLASHLVIKHNIQEDYFTSKEDLSSKFSESFYLLCCKCEEVFTERENFISHECMPVVKQCSMCQVKGSHTPLCPNNSKVKKSNPVSDVAVNRIPPVQNNDHPSDESVSLLNTTVSSESSATCVRSDEVRPLDSSTSSDSDVLNSSQEVSNVDSVNTSCIEDTSICDVTNNNHNETNIKCNTDTDVNEDDSHSLTNVTDSQTNQDHHDPVLDNNNIGTNDSTIHDTPDNMEVTPPETNTTQDNNLISNECNNTLSEPQTPEPPQTLYQIHPSVSWPRKYTPSLPSKPPPRNRRPPKRYQTSDSPEEPAPLPIVPYTPPPVVYTPPPVVHTPPPLPSVVETVNRVPKLTVKIPKTILEKESTSDYSSESEDSDKLTVDIHAPTEENEPEKPELDVVGNESEVEGEVEPVEEANVDVERPGGTEQDVVVAGDDIPLTDLTLDHPLDKYSLQELLKVFLTSTRFNCIYCNHARKIAVNGKQLGLHFVAQHRFSATVNSITAEELLPETIVLKVKSSLDEVENIYLNLDGYETNDKSEMKFYDQTLECFQCFYITTLQKDLCSHNRKMHQKTILLCIMCKSNFYSYSELLCHLCPGNYQLNSTSEMQFRCCLCPKDMIPSAFRLMVHLRKCHNSCDVCLEFCHNQSRLSNHVWKHKLHHLCYRCGIAYRNKPDITKHLFWKHGTQSVLCKKCLQKRWPHVYHFCIPPNTFLCEECNLTFTKAVSLKVHKRLHSNDFPYPCTQDQCQEKFVSKKLLNKHQVMHLEPTEKLEDPPKQQPIEDDKNDIIVIDDKPDDDITDQPVNNEKPDNQTTPTKLKKAKKNKKNKEKVNLLIDVNLPELNLSESDSSDESDTESAKKVENPSEETTEGASSSTVEPMVTDEVRPADTLQENNKQETTVPDVWDNFKMYQAQLEKETVSLHPPKPRHVCDSDHDYCVIPMSDYELEEQHRLHMDALSPTKEGRKKSKAKKKSAKKEALSSSDSSSDSDSSCSCGSNCSCSSSSGSSSSSSSSDSDSESTLSPKQNNTTKPHKDSDASAVLDVGMPIPEPVELPIAESDLETDETDTDEDFYDEYPQRLANQLLAEKRNKLLLLASVAPSVNNGTYVDSSRPVTPQPVEPIIESKKKVKSKKKKKPKKTAPLVVPPIKIPLRLEETPPPNKITISLQTNTVIDKTHVHSPNSFTSAQNHISDDNKRASKRRRVPNKFYGYSSDEEYMQKQQLPPKLEWRKEDLPSSSGVQHQPPPIPPPIIISGILDQEPRLVVSPKTFIKEPIYTSSDEDSDSSGEGALQINHPIAENMEPVSHKMYQPPYGMGAGPFPRPVGFRQAREGESVYCYCRCPYDEVSEMIACDAQGCAIEWFHFECVGITVPPKGRWYCPDCRQKDEYYGQMY